MIELILSVALLISTEFHDQVSCTVQGYVLRMDDGDTVQFSRADSCEGVKVEQDGVRIIFYSPNYWVAVLIPAEHGHRRLQYRWGSRFVHLGAETVPIDWGYVEHG